MGLEKLITKSCFITSHVKLLRNNKALGAPAPFWLLMVGSSHVFIGLDLPKGLITQPELRGLGGVWSLAEGGVNCPCSWALVKVL